MSASLPRTTFAMFSVLSHAWSWFPSFSYFRHNFCIKLIFKAKKSRRSSIIAGLFSHVFKELRQALCRDSLHQGCGTRNSKRTGFVLYNWSPAKKPLLLLVMCVHHLLKMFWLEKNRPRSDPALIFEIRNIFAS